MRRHSSAYFPTPPSRSNRRRVIFGNVRERIGEILRRLCERNQLEPVEGYAMVDDVYSAERRPFPPRRPSRGLPT